MAADEDLLKRVRAALQHVPGVGEKPMFGGLMFMVGGKMCVSVGRNRIMCRIDPAMHDAVLKRKGCRAVTMNGREYRGYVHIDREGVKSARDLAYWIDLALDQNTRVRALPRAGASPPRSRRRGKGWRR